MNKNKWRRVKALIGLSLVVSSGVVVAADVNVGRVTISIPEPESFSQATTPKMIHIGDLAMVKDDRLLAVFGLTAVVEKEAKGGIPHMDRYGFASTPRLTESYQIPLDRFGKYKSDSKALAVAGMSAADRAEVEENSRRAEKWIAADMRVKVQIDVPRIGSFAVLDETPTSLTMVMNTAGAVSSNGGDRKPVEMVVGMTQLLVKSKIIWLQLYATSHSRGDFDWVAKNIVKWSRAVSAANH